jgi:hypothetical protein
MCTERRGTLREDHGAMKHEGRKAVMPWWWS